MKMMAMSSNGFMAAYANADASNDALYFGGAFMAAHEAPMRISFNHVPDLELESDHH